MVRGLVVLSVMLAACAAEESPTITPLGSTPIQSLGLSSLDAMDQELAEGSEDTGTDEAELCALAEQLPADDLCSLICDPDALHQAMIDAGVETGRCYLMFCQMSETVTTSVGVCLL